MMRTWLIFTLLLSYTTTSFAIDFSHNCPLITNEEQLNEMLDDFEGLHKYQFCIEEAVDSLCRMRSVLLEEGYDVPLLSELFRQTVGRTESQGIILDSRFIEDFYSLVLCREKEELFIRMSYQRSNYHQMPPSFIQVRKKENQEDEFRVPDGVAIGFCKALAGGLFLIIPTGVTQAVGATLVVAGIDDMIKHANDPISEKSMGNFEDDLDRRQRITPESINYGAPHYITFHTSVIKV